jgi:SMC interacting uncharacterized protein involved in chromosome segregation
MSKRKNKKNKTETVAYDAPDRATLESALDSMSEECESYRIQVESLREDIRVAYEEIDTIQERKRELERAVVSQSIEIAQLRGMLRWEDDKKRVNAARKAEWIAAEDHNDF